LDAEPLLVGARNIVNLVGEIRRETPRRNLREHRPEVQGQMDCLQLLADVLCVALTNFYNVKIDFLASKCLLGY